MLWFFERREARLRYEVRREKDGPRYELVITWPDGHEEIEVFADADAVAARARHLQDHLQAEGWEAPATTMRARFQSRAPDRAAS
jgi:hypothetical protein